VSHGVNGRGKHQQLFWSVFAVALALVCAAKTRAQAKPRTQQPTLQLEAEQQRKVGPMFYADGHVVVHYGPVTIHADHVQYNEKTKRIEIRGHVRFDYHNQTIEGTGGWYDVSTGRGSFRNVRGTIRAMRRPNPSLLVSPNPLTFRAKSVERTGPDTYVIHHAWLTVCDPKRPKWKFYTGRAVIDIGRSAKLYGANFRMFSIPLVYLPYASLPAGKNLRQSGFLIPDVGESSLKGFVIGDSYYWAPTNWFDMTVGGQYYSRRGWSQMGSLRATPTRNIRFSANYFGVSDRGTPGPNDTNLNEGGYNANETFDGLFHNGWRIAANLNQLSSLQFRQVFSASYSQAVNPEVRSSAFATNNFDGYSLDFAAENYKNFLTLQPEEAVVARRAPEARFSSIDRPLFRKLPLYLSFHMFTGAVYRSESSAPQSDTGPAVQRSEIAPSLTLPVHLGPWLGITPTFGVRATRYGAQQTPSGAILNTGISRATEELTVDIRPPAFARVWGSKRSRWKHAIEPEIVYRNVNGVDNFSQFIPFSADETLTNTNEIDYSITQRLFHRSADGSSSQLVSWRLAQNYYFDPTFGGALVPGQRNVFQALDSLTPFAFVDRARQLSPVISDLRITPGGRWDVQLRQDFDPVLGRMTASGTLVKIHPWREMFFTVAHFDIHTDPVLQPTSNQIQAMAGYGDLNRRGWNTSFGISYDAHQHLFQNQVAEISYNGSCCGIAFEYRRLALGPLRTENQFRIALLIANIGTFGNIARREKIF
jgi:LPS-assembly protein